MSTDGLTGRVAVVTGALGILGPVWTKALADAGATVVGIDVRDGEGILPGDVTDRASLEGVLAEVAGRHGPPSILVNNAGIDVPPGQTDDLSFRETLDVNIAGVFNATQVFGQAMCGAGRGSIVNIGSLYASVAPVPAFYEHLDPPFTKPAAYGASKAAVVNLTRYFARLWGAYGVRVNALSPGGVRGGQDPEFVRRYSERVALGRMADPADLTGPMLFLVSDASRYVTGHELLVDGGFTA